MARSVLTHSNSYATALDWLSRPGQPQVVTPSGLAARALQVPHQSLGQWAIQAIEAGGWKIATDLTAQRLFRQVVQKIVQPVDNLGTARAWGAGVRSLLQSSPDLGGVTATSDRTALLLDVARAYQAALGAQKLIDGADLYWRAAQLKAAPQRVLVYGYFQLRPDERAWINVLAAEGSALFLPIAASPLFAENRAAVDWLVGEGWQRVGDSAATDVAADGGGVAIAPWPTLPHRSPGVAYAYSTLEAEARGTLTQVKSLLNSGTPARDIAIIARDEAAYGPKLIDIAWEYGLPLRALYPTPLLTTRLGAWLNLLLKVLDANFPFEDTARLLSHVLASNPDRHFWATARHQHPQGFAPWKTLAQDQLDLDLSILTQINQSRRRDTWVELWQNILRTFNLRRRCARWARESVAINTFLKALSELAKPEAQILTWGDFRQELRDLLDRLTVPAQPGRGGVELHSPRSVMGARYAHLFVMGMAEGVLPGPVGNDPLLDFFERRQLRPQGVTLPSAAELARREGLNVYFLLQTVTTSAVFSYPQLDGRRGLLPSPYLGQFGLEPGDPPAWAIASPEELRRTVLRHPLPVDDPAEDLVLPQAAHALGVEQGREGSDAPNEYDGVIGIPLDYAHWTFSVSQLRNLGQCPFKWFAQKQLKLGPPAEVEEDLNPSQIGQLYHRVLELVLAQRQHNAALVLADPAVLQQAFAIAESEIIPQTSPTWLLRRDEHLRVLSLTLQAPSFLPAGAEPVALEAQFSGDWHGLKVQGRVDRIDRTADGLVLIDYKTGKSRPTGIKDQTGKACIDLQIPLYREAAGPGLFADQPVARAYYYSIRGRAEIPLSSKAPQHELPAAIERCKTHLETGHYPVQPDQARSACAYCDFDALCRQGDRLSRKDFS